MYMLRGYHSLSASGTQNAPQWMKMPRLFSRKNGGIRNAASDSHSG